MKSPCCCCRFCRRTGNQVSSFPGIFRLRVLTRNATRILTGRDPACCVVLLLCCSTADRRPRWDRCSGELRVWDAEVPRSGGLFFRGDRRELRWQPRTRHQRGTCGMVAAGRIPFPETENTSKPRRQKQDPGNPQHTVSPVGLPRSPRHANGVGDDLPNVRAGGRSVCVGVHDQLLFRPEWGVRLRPEQKCAGRNPNVVRHD